jgi:sugar phosphate isomerase/epimerase
MYAGVRDWVLLYAGYESVGAGLSDLAVPGIELEFDREGTVLSLDPEAGNSRVSLLEDAGLEAILRQRDALGVRISAFLLANDFGHEDRASEIDWVVSAARSAHALGVPAVRIDAIMHGERELPLAERQDIFHSSMAEVLRRTEAYGTDFGIENHGFQGNDPEFLAGVFGRTDDPRLGLTMDTGNFYWYGHPLERVYEILERFAPRTKHTHVKNIRYPENVRHERREMGWEYGTYCAPIPDGDIDHAKLVGYLRAVGYDRDFTVEDESLGKFAAGAERLDVLRREVAYVASLIA